MTLPQSLKLSGCCISTVCESAAVDGAGGDGACGGGVGESQAALPFCQQTRPGGGAGR